MGETTGISWTDSTYNPWIGCTDVGPGCQNCYAIGVGKRLGVEWGKGSARRQSALATRNAPLRWQKKAAAFKAEHGHPRRVFCSSLADIFDNEVDPAWQVEAFATMAATPDLRWQLCTKRVSNIAKMVPLRWINYGSPSDIISLTATWPRNVGILITTVTPEEVRRDVPRLVDLKRRFHIPWIGLSIEPMIEDVANALVDLGALLQDVDWIILGGESGPHARPCDLDWILRALAVSKARGCSVFVKQLGADCRGLDGGRLILNDPAGKDRGEWPPGSALHTFEFPESLR